MESKHINLYVLPYKPKYLLLENVQHRVVDCFPISAHPKCFIPHLGYRFSQFAAGVMCADVKSAASC